MKNYMILSLFLLSACGPTVEKIKNIGKAPQMSVMDPPVQWATTDNNNEKAANSLWKTGSRSFFTDTTVRKIGDLLQVTVNINDNVAISNDYSATRDLKKEKADMNELFGRKNKITKKLIPIASTASSILDLTSSSDNSGKGTVNRTDTVQTVVAAMVTDILPNGNLIIKGNQEIRVNYELRAISIAGIVRPADISVDNKVDASQMAEARISIGGKGVINNVQQPRYGEQFIDAIAPW